jgi:hypothetical protein
MSRAEPMKVVGEEATGTEARGECCLRGEGCDDDDDVVYLKDYNEGVTESNPQKCRPAKGISKRVNIQIIKDTDMIEQPNDK